MKLLSLLPHLISCSPLIDYLSSKIRLKFSRGSLQQRNNSIYTHGTIVNIYTVYKLGASSSFNNDPTLENSLLGAVRLTKNADIDKYQYSGYGIGFDRKSCFSFPGDEFGQNVIILGVDMSSSVHIDNERKDILILGNGPTKGLEHTLTAKKCIQLILL